MISGWWIAAYFVFSAVVSGMPEPAPNSGKAYVWAYHSLAVISGDLSSLIGSRAKPK